MDETHKLINFAKKNKEGFTVRLVKGKIVPVKGTMQARYSVAGDTSIVYVPKEKNIQIYSTPKKDGYYGGWFDKETGKYLIEHVNLYSNQKHALTVAKKRKQKAIFDLLEMNEIKVRYAKPVHITGMRIKTVSKKKMGDYVAVHGKLPKNELPKRFKNIPKKDILIRGGLTKKRRKEVLSHEKEEIPLMDKGMPYKKAHRKADRILKQRKRGPVVIQKGRRYLNRLTGKYVSESTAMRLNKYFKKHPGGTLYEAQRRPIYKKKVDWGKQPKYIQNLYKKRKTQVVKTKDVHGKDVYFSPGMGKRVNKQIVQKAMKLNFTEGIFNVQLFRMSTNKQKVFHLIKTNIGFTLKEDDDLDRLEKKLTVDWLEQAMEITYRIAKKYPIAKRMIMHVSFNHDIFKTNVSSKDNGAVTIMEGFDPLRHIDMLPSELKRAFRIYHVLLQMYNVIMVKNVTIFIYSNRPTQETKMVAENRLGILNRNGN